MLRQSFLRRCAAKATPMETMKAASESGHTPAWNLYKWAVDNNVRVTGVEYRPQSHNHPCRGLVATQAHREGTTLISAPLRTFAVNAEKLSALEFVKASNPPKRSFVRQELLNAGVRDSGVADQVYLSLLLAAERMNPESKLAPYFECLPHPAIDDEAVLQSHAEGLSELDQVQWQTHREDYVGVLRMILQHWENSAKPPIQIVDWAWRTVLARAHLLPDHGAPPPNYNKLGFVSWFLMNGDRTFINRMKDKILNPKSAELDYQLVPTLVPFIDAIDHSPAANVSVEVADRGSFGTCVEIQAVTDIKAGEEVALTFSRAHTIPFTLYRFGFVPQ